MRPCGIRLALKIQPGEHGENAETKRRMRNLMDVAGILDRLVDVRPDMATEEDILRVHTKDYLKRIIALSAERGGDSRRGDPRSDMAVTKSPACRQGARSPWSMRLSPATSTTATRWCAPPGHHAEPDIGRGFCIFGNVGIAIEHARKHHGLERCAVVDWDVHHGNGTERIFYEDRDVLTISIHQDNWYPADSGHIHHVGESDGKGANINVPAASGIGQGTPISGFSSAWWRPLSGASSRNSSSLPRASMDPSTTRWGA